MSPTKRARGRGTAPRPLAHELVRRPSPECDRPGAHPSRCPLGAPRPIRRTDEHVWAALETPARSVQWRPKPERVPEEKGAIPSPNVVVHPARAQSAGDRLRFLPRSSGSRRPFRRCPPLAAAQACPTSRTESAQNPGPGRIRAARASVPPARSITCRSTIGLEAGGTSAPRWTRALANGGDEKRVAAVGSSSRKENGRAARRIRVRRAA